LRKYIPGPFCIQRSLDPKHLVDPAQIFFPRDFIYQVLMEGSVLFPSSLMGILDDQEIKLL